MNESETHDDTVADAVRRRRLNRLRGGLPGSDADDRLQVEKELCGPEPKCERAGGGVECSVCGKEYWRHPGHARFRWMTVLCGGRCVKL